MAGIHAIECMRTEQSSKFGVPQRVASADIQGCVDCEVHYMGSMLYTCSMGHTFDAIPNGSNASIALPSSASHRPRAGRTVLLLNLVLSPRMEKCVV